MLATSAIVEAVAAAIEELDLPLVVLDPVLVSSSGSRLLDDDGVAALREALIPLARVVTPNIPEAEALSGVRIATPADARAAARRIQEMGAAARSIISGNRARVRCRARRSASAAILKGSPYIGGDPETGRPTSVYWTCDSAVRDRRGAARGGPYRGSARGGGVGLRGLGRRRRDVSRP